MWILKNKTNEQTQQSRNRFTDIENKQAGGRGEDGMGMEISEGD